MTLLGELKSVLKKDERLVKNSELLTNTVTELALKMDKNLIKLLMSEKKIKEHFFVEVSGALVFDREKFINFITIEKFLPDSYTKFKQNIGLTVDSDYLAKSGEVVLAWPYKDCVLEGGQEKEDEKRAEIFYNETLAPDEIDRLLDPKVFTNFKRVDAKGEHKVTEMKTTDNLIIKGNSLLVLHSLKKKFAGKVKLVYIDPPYGKNAQTFYNDTFKNSTWLTFMKNRLEVAKQLLRNDGIIFIQIDDEQYAYLKVLCDDNGLFGRDNYLSTITVKSKTPSGVGQESLIFDITERILVYAKDITNISRGSLKIFDEIVDENSRTVDNYNLVIEDVGSEDNSFELRTGRGKRIKVVKLRNFKFKKVPKKECTKQWAYNNYPNIFRLSPAKGGLMKKITPQLPKEPCFIEYVPEKGKYADQTIRVYFVHRDMVVMLSETSVRNVGERVVEKLVNIHNNWTDESLWQGIAREGGVSLPHGKKPETLIKRIIDLSFPDTGDIVLDFFAGTGTTCAVAHKMNFQYIGVEQLDYGKNSAVVRLKNVINGDQSGISKVVNWKGGGDFVYCEPKELNELFVRKLLKVKRKAELLKIWNEMKRNGFLSYRVDKRLFNENIEEFKKLPVDEQRRLLIECLDKNHLYVNYSEIEDRQYKVSRGDIAINRKFYGGA